MRARAIFVATGIFRPADSGRTEYALAGFSLHRLFTRAIGPRQPRRAVFEQVRATPLLQQRLPLPGVVDAGLLEAPCQSLTPELREASRVGHRAHIDQALHAARLQQRDEALDGMVGMADRS